MTSAVAPSSGPSHRYRCVILGCTGTVGQRFIQLLASHPWFEASCLAASPRTAGKSYVDACQWKLAQSMPDYAKQMQIQQCTVEHVNKEMKRRDPEGVAQNRPLIAFSALDASVAGEIETAFAHAGYRVFSNARNHRMDADVPILIPHVNGAHLSLLRYQQSARGFTQGGFIVTNANCSSTGLVIALAPIQQQFGLEKVMVVTMQAISGAGYPGVSSLDILDNIVPHISGEEDKMECEPNKILGIIATDSKSIQDATIRISAMCNRVPVIDGHMECVSIKTVKPATPEDISQCLSAYQSEAQLLQLPSAPPRCIELHLDASRPQPRLDRDAGQGMTVSVGRVRACPLFDVKFALCSHNTVIGAAGGSIQNAELAHAKGFMESN